MSDSMTLHLDEMERSFLTQLLVQRELARQQLQACERDFTVAGTALAATRGINPKHIGDLTPEGLVVVTKLDDAPAPAPVPTGETPEPPAPPAPVPPNLSVL